jgi:hypothetical protein
MALTTVSIEKIGRGYVWRGGQVKDRIEVIIRPGGVTASVLNLLELKLSADGG